MKRKMEYWTSVANSNSEYWLRPNSPVEAPTSVLADELAGAYWASLSESLAHAVSVDGDALGPVALRIGRRGPVILSFEQAVVSPVEGGIEVRFPIEAGFAASQPGGELRLVARTVGSRVTLGVVVDGYRPRFEKLRILTFPIAAPYTLAQHLVHRWVTRKSLVRLAEVIQ